ncbi:MAG: glycerol-3-phosphate 1-O-acyltransferase PlsY [Burkholderiales bacterium]|nr:glycerol-3-phosphate 1-O-acyltransferase PlsY [Burkholderiales bacterium]
MTLIALVLLAYLIGSVSFAVLVSRALGLPDPRSYGSGNPGATNVLRAGRKTAAVLTLLGDIAKGWLAVFIAQRYADPGTTETVMALAALAVVLGHVYPVFFRFQGGKGASTALGVLVAFNAYLAAGTAATWIIIAVFFRISSLASLIAALFAPSFALILYNPVHPYLWSLVAIAILLIWRHRANIRNLIEGREGRIGSRETGPPQN